MSLRVLTREEANEAHTKKFAALTKDSFFDVQFFDKKTNHHHLLYLVVERIDEKTLQVIELSALENIAAIAAGTPLAKKTFVFDATQCINILDYGARSLFPLSSSHPSDDEDDSEEQPNDKEKKTKKILHRSFESDAEVVDKNKKRIHRFFERHRDEIENDQARGSKEKNRWAALWLEKTAPHHKDVKYAFFNKNDEEESALYRDEQKYTVFELDE